MKEEEEEEEEECPVWRKSESHFIHRNSSVNRGLNGSATG